MKEEELVYNYRLGNKGAISSLFSIYEKKVVPFYNQYEKIFEANGYDYEDMKGFVRKCVLTSIQNYRFGEKSFNTYYSAVAYRSVITLYRQIEGKVENKMIDYSLSLSDVEVQDRFNYQISEEKKIDLDLVMEKVKSIGEIDYKILKYYLEGNSYNEIAKKVGLKPKSVCNYLQKIRSKLKKWIIK